MPGKHVMGAEELTLSAVFHARSSDLSFAAVGSQ
jgi:hypothetical protein